jgi:hypothetical protein
VAPVVVCAVPTAVVAAVPVVAVVAVVACVMTRVVTIVFAVVVATFVASGETGTMTLPLRKAVHWGLSQQAGYVAYGMKFR